MHKKDGPFKNLKLPEL